MKLLPLLWLLCGLLLVVGDQDPPVAPAPAPAPKAPIADNSTVAAQGKPTSAAAPLGATGTPLPPAGSAAGKVQTSDQSVPKATKAEPKEADKTPAASENPGKNRGRTDTGSPKAAGEVPVAASTAKPAVVESKASTAAAGAGAAGAAPSAAAASPKPNSNDTAPVSSTSTKASTSTSTTTTAKPAAGSAIVTEGQSMKDVTKPTNSSINSNTTSTMASTKTTTIKTTPKPTKPPVVYSMGTHSEWEKGQEQQGKDGAKPLPLPKPVSTLAEPVPPQVQELTGNLSDRGRDTGYVVPIVTVLLTVPLAIGVVTIMYRRFRDMWSTRHYRRMDFLVDGMYND